MKKKILICGAGGFIGGHLAARFLKSKDFPETMSSFKIWYFFLSLKKSIK